MPGHTRRITAYIMLFALIVTLGVAGVASARFSQVLALDPASRQTPAHPARRLASEACTTCHASPHRPPRASACENCHTTGTWTSLEHRHANAIFDQGGHKSVPCARCHINGGAPSGAKCGSCHSTTVHRVDRACQLCHTVSAWKPALVQAPSSHPPLAGTHAKATCPDCHTLARSLTTTTPSEWKNTTFYSVAASGSIAVSSAVGSANASGSATPVSVAVYDRTPPRTSSDATSSYVGTATMSFQATDSASGVAVTYYTPDGGLSVFAGSTYTTSALGPQVLTYWSKDRAGNIESPRMTAFSVESTDTAFPTMTSWYCTACHEKHSKKFPLEGPHGKVSCTTCHASSPKSDNLNKVVVRVRDCKTCHGVRHASLTNCGQCHTTQAFKPSTFSHDKSTWPLTGAHNELACAKCHQDKQWAQSAGTTCVQCHGARHAGLTACRKCHTTTAFSPSTFDHSLDSWSLTGAHKTVACARCHPSQQWARSKGTTCLACHGVKHGVKIACQTCHTTKAWVPIKVYQHTTAYPLVGQHKFVNCVACHKRAVFPGTPTRCVSCHADRSHGMPNCELCHTPVSWSFILPHHEHAGAGS